MLRDRLILLCVLAFGGPALALDARDVKRATDRGGNWLIEQFDLKEKVFGKGEAAKDPMTVAICVCALLDNPRDYKETNGPFISEPVKYLAAQLNEDGSLKKPAADEWQTLAWMLTALKHTNNEKHGPLAEKVRTQFFKVGTGQDNYSKFLTDDFNVAADALSLRKQLYHAQKLSAAGKKEIESGGQTIKWAEVLAENVIKLQQKNGSFGDSVEVNGLALHILNYCYKAMK